MRANEPPEIQAVKPYECQRAYDHVRDNEHFPNVECFQSDHTTENQTETKDSGPKYIYPDCGWRLDWFDCIIAPDDT